MKFSLVCCAGALGCASKDLQRAVALLGLQNRRSLESARSHASVAATESTFLRSQGLDLGAFPQIQGSEQAACQTFYRESLAKTVRSAAKRAFEKVKKTSRKDFAWESSLLDREIDAFVARHQPEPIRPNPTLPASRQAPEQGRSQGRSPGTRRYPPGWHPPG